MMGLHLFTYYIQIIIISDYFIINRYIRSIIGMSLKQIFRKEIPNEILFNLLEQICLKTTKYYLIDINTYKKLLYHELHIPFLDTLIEYYHESKRFYIKRNVSYNSFINIIRQICKNNNIVFSSQIKYNKSKYNIDYFIFYTQTYTSVLGSVESNGMEYTNSVVDNSIIVDNGNIDETDFIGETDIDT